MAAWGAGRIRRSGTFSTPAWCWAVLMNPVRAPSSPVFSGLCRGWHRLSLLRCPGEGRRNPAGKGTSCPSPRSLPPPPPRGQATPPHWPLLAFVPLLTEAAAPLNTNLTAAPLLESTQDATAAPTRGPAAAPATIPFWVLPGQAGSCWGLRQPLSLPEPIKGLRGSRLPRRPARHPCLWATVLGHCLCPPPPQTPTGGSCEKPCHGHAHLSQR